MDCITWILLEEPFQLVEAARTSFTAGAAGISLFSLRSMTEAHWQELGKALKEAVAS